MRGIHACAAGGSLAELFRKVATSQLEPKSQMVGPGPSHGGLQGAPGALIKIRATDDYEAAIGSLLGGGVPVVCQQALRRVAESLHCSGAVVSTNHIMS